METANLVIEEIIEIGPVAILPVLLFLIGLATTRKILQNFLNCLYIFLGLIGLSISLTLLVNYFKPLIDIIVSFSKNDLTVVDTGWLVSKQVILNSPVTLYVLMAVLVVNIIMILLRLTRSVNLDLWNWWIFLAAGSVVYFVTEKEWLAVLSACVISIITLVLSDIYAPKFESYYEIKGITNTQAQLIAWAPLTQLVNTVFNRIPGIKKIRIVFFRLYYRLGFFSEPLIIGFILGFIFGAVIKYRTIHINTGRDILFAAAYGLYLAAIVIVIPKMSALIFKGLSPAIKDLVKFIESRITKRSIHISLDSILFSGHPSVISISVVFIPLTAYIATILPGNKILPSADLILIPLLLVWILAQSKGDLIRTFISASLIIPLTLWISTDMADLFTGFFSKHSIEMAQDIKHFSSYGAGSNWFFWVILQIIRPLLNIFS